MLEHTRSSHLFVKENSNLTKHIARGTAKWLALLLSEVSNNLFPFKVSHLFTYFPVTLLTARLSVLWYALVLHCQHTAAFSNV